MPNDWFQFRHFLIRQNRCAMKVGTDSVLLGAWVPLSGKEKKIADLGTGTGLLALIMAQRSSAIVTGFESDADAAMQATENFTASPWSDRLNCQHTDIRFVKEDNFDVCIFNPPYFNRQLQSPDLSRNRARHMVDQTPDNWMKSCAHLLHKNGFAGMVIPVQEEEIWLQAVADNGFFVHQQILVSGRPGKTPVRILFWLGRNELSVIQSELVIETNIRGEYSHEFQILVADIYPDRIAKVFNPL